MLDRERGWSVEGAVAGDPRRGHTEGELRAREALEEGGGWSDGDPDPSAQECAATGLSRLLVP